MAERVGFEPTLEFPLNTLSKRAPSATRPSLHRKLHDSSENATLNLDNLSVCYRALIGGLLMETGEHRPIHRRGSSRRKEPQGVVRGSFEATWTTSESDRRASGDKYPYSPNSALSESERALEA